MSIKEYVRNKHTYITSRLARMFLISKEGDSIPTINDLTQIFSVGSGTVQNAIQQLKREAAVEIETRGFLGSYITKLDYRKLWELSDFGVLLGLCPLATNAKIPGIADGIHKCFAMLDIHIHIAFMPGSINRIDTLINEKSDFVVMSELAYLQAKKEQEPIEKVLDLGERTYAHNEEFALLVLKKKYPKNLPSNCVVGINKYSYDDMTLMENLSEEIDIQIICKESFELMNGLKAEEMDAIVVHTSENDIDEKEFQLYPLTQFQSIGDMIKKAENAVVVVRDDNNELRKILARRINPRMIHDVQNI